MPQNVNFVRRGGAASRVSTKLCCSFRDFIQFLMVHVFQISKRCFGRPKSSWPPALPLLQYRNKLGNSRKMLDDARELRARVGTNVKLIMNDRADLCLAVQYDGLHVGQDDLPADPLAASSVKLDGSEYRLIIKSNLRRPI